MDLIEFKKKLTDILKQKFQLKDEDIWVWEKNPNVEGVKAFYGNGVVNNAVVIWVTERPSSARYKRKQNKFPDKIDDIFYRLLKEEGFENMHLTDFVKIMNKAGKNPTDEELIANTELMKDEIEMLVKRVEGKKLIIVANSDDVKTWMKRYLPEYSPYVAYKKFFKWYFQRSGLKWDVGKERLRQDIKDIYNMTK